MQVHKKNPMPCRRPLIAALATLASCAAWADEPSPWYIGATQSLTHDSNVFRIPNGTGDNYSSTGLVGGFDQSIGRQHLTGSANIRYNKYQQEDRLNNTSYGLNAGWDWATINNLSGGVSVSANQNLAAFDGNAAVPTTERNLVKSDQISTNVQWGGAGRLSLRGDYAHSRVSYSAPTSIGGESSADTGSFGSYYSVSPALKVGGALRFTRTVSPFGAQTQTNPPAFESTSSNGRNVDLSVDWVYSALTGVNARLSWTRQSNSGASGRDFSGLTGALSAQYAPTAKTSFNASYNRDAGTNGTFFNVASTPTSTSSSVVLYENSQVTDALAVGANYAATAKIGVNAGLQYRRAKIVNSIATGGGSASGGDYDDSLRSATLGVNYAIARAWSLSCNLSHENRKVTGATGYEYSANVASCSAQVTLR